MNKPTKTADDAIQSIIQEWNAAMMFGSKEVDAIQKIGKKAKAALLAAELERIGEDEQSKPISETMAIVHGARDGLRAELRKAAQEFWK